MHLPATDGVKENSMDRESATLNQIRNEGEKLLWRHQPSLFNFIFGYLEIWYTLITALLVIMALVIAEAWTYERLLNWHATPLVIGTVLLALILLVVKRIIDHATVSYGLTNKRILFCDGFIFREHRSLDLAQVEKVEVKRNLFQFILGTGSIRFMIKNEEGELFEEAQIKFEQWNDVKRPLATSKKIQKLI